MDEKLTAQNNQQEGGVPPAAGESMSPPINPNPGTVQQQPTVTVAQPAAAPQVSQQPPVANETSDNFNQAPASYPAQATPPQAPLTPRTTSKKKKRLALVAVLALVVMLGSSAAAYFGYVVPNQPENVWAKALSNTADGFDTLSELAEEQVDAKGIEVNGTVSFSTPDVSGDGNISFESYENQGQGVLDIGVLGSRYELEVRGIKKDTAKTPDLYVKAKGLAGLAQLAGPAGAAYGPAVEAVNDTWIFVDHSLLDQALASVEQDEANSANIPSFTAEELQKISSAVSEANRKYLLASDENAVFTVVEEVGKEDFEGRSSFHYKVGANSEKVAAYLEALKSGLADTKVKELAGDNYDKSFDEAIQEMREVKGNDSTVDVWVDMGTKTIRNIRVTSQEDDSQLDISMLYDGGDVFPFELKMTNFTDDDSDAEVTIGVSINTNEKSTTVSVNAGATKPSTMQLTSSFTIKARNEPINVEVPADTKTVNEIMSLLSAASPVSSSSYQLDAGNAESDENAPSLLNQSILNGFQL